MSYPKCLISAVTPPIKKFKWVSRLMLTATLFSLMACGGQSSSPSPLPSTPTEPSDINQEPADNTQTDSAQDDTQAPSNNDQDAQDSENTNDTTGDTADSTPPSDSVTPPDLDNTDDSQTPSQPEVPDSNQTPITNAYPEWDASIAYVAGNRVSLNGQAYEAKWWNLDESPEFYAGGFGKPWLILENEPQEEPTATPPAAPSNAVAQITDETVTLRWQDQSNNEERFYIERRQSNNEWQHVSDSSANATSFLDQNVTLGESYTYRIRSENQAGTSTFITSNSVKLEAIQSIPNAPSNIFAVSSAAGDLIGVSWTDNADNEQGYLLERKIDGNDWFELTTINADTTTYTDSNIDEGHDYQYRVLAFNGAGNSQTATSVTVTIEEDINNNLSLFEQNCQQCHHENTLGPNLFDGFTKNRWNSKSYDEFLTTVSGMPVAQCDENCQLLISEFIWVDSWQFAISDNTNDLQAGVRGARKLTPYEIKNTVKNIFNLEISDDELPKDHFSADFRYPTQSSTGLYLNSDVNEIFNLLEKSVAQIELGLLGCSNNDCSNQKLIELLTQILKRSLTAEEQNTYINIQTEHGSKDALLSALLTPDFLYHLELGDWNALDKSYELSNAEIRNLLAFSLWGEAPDTALINDSANLNLTDQTELSNLIDEMLDDPRFSKNFNDFISFYTHSYQPLSEKPGLSNDLINMMIQEQNLFIHHLFTIGSGRFEELFNPGYSFINSALSSHYDMNSVNSEDHIYTTTGRHRGGLLHLGVTQVSNSDFAATSLVRRGKMIRENIMCHKMGVPSGVDPATINLPNHAITTRERWDIITGADASEGQCWACHQLMNEPGSAMESFDQTGKYRTHEPAYNDSSTELPIESAGILRDNSGQSELYNYEDLRDLSEYLSNDNSVKDCFVESFYRHASGQELNALNQLELSRIQTQFRESGDIKTMIKNILISDITLKRQDASQ